MNDYKEFSLESSAWFRTIKAITFTPTKEVNVTKRYSKGDKKYWKLFGLIPLFSYVVKDDLYTTFEIGLNIRSNKLYTLKDIQRESWYPLDFNNDGKLYRLAKVYISTIDRSNSRNKYFESNEEAMKFINDLKIKCKEVGNELK